MKPLPGDLLVQALTHSSYLNESGADVQSNERLEFLGDAVLGLVIANELFGLYTDAGEGDLTRMRAEVVRGSTLAGVASRIRLGEQLIMGRGEEAARQPAKLNVVAQRRYCARMSGFVVAAIYIL